MEARDEEAREGSKERLGESSVQCAKTAYVRQRNERAFVSGTKRWSGGSAKQNAGGSCCSRTRVGDTVQGSRERLGKGGGMLHNRCCHGKR
jgi:hypothetical protein